jgi:hypothetical protein
MTGAERVVMALSMSEAAHELAVAGIRHRHPLDGGAGARRPLGTAARNRKIGAVGVERPVVVWDFGVSAMASNERQNPNISVLTKIF